MKKKTFKNIITFLLTTMMIIGCLSLTSDINVKAAEITNEGDCIDYAYTGGIQTFTAPYKGLYKLEVWGASGGGVAGYTTGGNGGYSVGYATLNKGQTVYIVVGGAGGSGGGYNGGGDSNGNNGGTDGQKQRRGGGGATHMSLRSGVLSAQSSYRDAIFLVAGGGGGAGADLNHTGRGNGGAGGGANGGTGTGAGVSAGGTQSSGYAFGQGAVGSSSSSCGGGGGFFGGYGGYEYSGGGGGSGYIGGVPALTFQGNSYEPQTSSGVNSGHGKAKITYVKSAVKKEVKYLEYLSVAGHGTQLFERDYTEGTWVQWYVKCSVLYAPDDATYTWYKDGVKLSDTDSSITASQTGLYKCVCKQGDTTLFEDTYDVKIDRSIQKISLSQLRYNGKKQPYADYITAADNGSKMYFYKNDVTVSLADIMPDTESGIKDYRFHWINTSTDNEIQDTIVLTPEITFSDSGKYIINGYVRDNAGNDSDGYFAEEGDYKLRRNSNTAFYIDKKPPTISKLTYSKAVAYSFALTVNATDYEDGSGIKEYYYIKNGVESAHQASNEFTINANGSYTFYAVDNLGWVSTGKSCTISNIDHLAPTITSATFTVSTSGLNGEVKIIGNDDGDSDNASSGIEGIALVPKGTVLTEDDWYHTSSFYSEGLYIARKEKDQNGLCELYIRDKMGNVSAPYEIYIDLTPPTVSYKFSPYLSKWTADTVTLTLTVSDDVGIAGISFDGGTTYSMDTTKTFTENEKFRACVLDVNGNVWWKDLSVYNIDRIAPVATLEDKVETEEYADLTVKISDEIGGIKKYIWTHPDDTTDTYLYPDSDVPKEDTLTIRATQNGVYSLLVIDKASNESTSYFTVTNVVPEYTLGDTASLIHTHAGEFKKTSSNGCFTSKDVNNEYICGNTDAILGTLTMTKINASQYKLKIEGTMNSNAEIVSYAWTGVDTASSIHPDGHKPSDADSITGSEIQIQDFGKYSCLINYKDKFSGKTYGVRFTYTVEDIDLTPPTIESITPSTTEWTNEDITLTVNATDDSGIEGYSIDGISYQASNVFTVTGNDTYLISVKDIHGNVEKKSIIVSNIDRNVPTVTASKVSESVTEVKYSLSFTDAEELSEFWIISNGVETKNPLGGISGTKEVTLGDNGSYIVRVFDKAGNEAKTSFIVTCIVKDYTLDEVANIFHFHYGTPNSTTANGCYTVPVTTTRTVTDSYKCGDWERDDSVEGAYCSGCGAFSYKCAGGYSHYETKTTTKTVTIYNCNRLAEAEGSMVLTKDISDVYKLKIVDNLTNATVVSYAWKGSDVAGTYPSLHPNGYKPSDVDTVTTGEITVPDFGKYTCIVTYKDLISGGTYKVNFYYTVEDFDLTPPTIESITPSTTEWTNQDVTLTVVATDNFAVTGIILSTDSTLTKDDIVGTQTVYTITENGTYYIYARDAIGNFTKEEYVVGNIDKVKPVIEKIEQVYIENDIEKTADITETISVREKVIKVTATDALSGLNIKAYRFKNKDGKWTEWQESELLKDIYFNGTYAVEVRDKAGNISSSDMVIAGMLETGAVTITDVGDDGTILGEIIKEYPLFTTVAGSDIGADNSLSAYYEGYSYSSCTSVVVGINDNKVTRSFIIAKYNVTFHGADGNAIGKEVVYYSRAITGTYVPFKDPVQTPTGYTSYIFDHWVDKDGNIVDTSQITKDMDLYPVFEEIETGFIQVINFHYNDSCDTVVTQFVERGSAASVPEPYKETETIDGGLIVYDFKCWINSDGLIVNDFSDIQSDGDYYATYTKDTVLEFEEITLAEVTAEDFSEATPILLVNAAEDDSDLIAFVPNEVIEEMPSTVNLSEWIEEATDAVAPVATVGALALIASLLTNGLFGTGVVQTGIFVFAYVFKASRYTAGAWLTGVDNIKYVDKLGREVIARFNEQTQTLEFVTKRGKDLKAVIVDDAIKDLRAMRIDYDQFDKLLKKSQVYTVFDKEVKLEVVTAKGTSKSVEGLRFTRNLKNLANDMSIQLKNGANELICEIKEV